MGKIKIKGKIEISDMLILFAGLTGFVFISGLFYVFLLSLFNVI
jgi:hypothetical protein